MPRKRKNINPDNVIKLYQSGKSIKELYKLYNCRSTVISDILNKAGIKTNTRLDLPTDEIVALYTDGMSVNALAGKFGVSRNVIDRRLKEAGIVIRNNAEANRLMMSKRTTEENARNVEAAHDAVRGKRRPHEKLCNRARTVERNFSGFSSTYERAIADEFSKRGIKFIPQKAVDKYNVDFAVFDNIAFEVYGGGWHSTGRAKARFSERSKKLFDCGYTIVICWVAGGCAFIPSAIVDYLISLNEKLCSDPSARGQHYVIRCDGEASSIGCTNLNYIT